MSVSATKAIDYGAGTVSDTALALTDLTGIEAETLDAADRVRLTVNTNAIRYRYDGGDPTTSEGHYVATNGELVLDGNDKLQKLRLIRSGADDTTVSATLEAY